MNKRIAIFIGSFLLVIASVLLISDDLFSPYVTFSKAKASPGEYVQVIGKLNKEVEIVSKDDSFIFSMLDEDNKESSVFHKGIKPQNFEHATQIVVIGRYNTDANRFTADKILTKCPSKYQKEK